MKLRLPKEHRRQQWPRGIAARFYQRGSRHQQTLSEKKSCSVDESMFIPPFPANPHFGEQRGFHGEHRGLDNTWAVPRQNRRMHYGTTHTGYEKMTIKT